MDDTAATPKAKERRWFSLGTGIAVVAIVALAAVIVLPPLFPTHAYSVRYSVNNEQFADAEVFRPFLMGHLLYLRLPGVSETRYSWFLVDLRRGVVSWPAGHDDTSVGVRYIHRDSAFGVRLTDSKMEDHWTVSFESGDVTFYNETIHVTVNRQSR